MTHPPEADEISSDTAGKNRKRPIRNHATISAELRARLQSEAERTGANGSRLLRGARDKPTGLNSGIVRSWLHGTTKTASPIHIEYALKQWAAMPDNRRISFTPEMRAMLKAEFVRTGTGPSTILRRAKDCPAGFSDETLQSLLTRNINTVGETYWEYVIARLNALPDRNPEFFSPGHRRQSTEPISDSDLTELRRLRVEIGVGGAALLGRATDVPLGLSPAMINHWVAGTVRTAFPEHIAYVLARYHAWPSSKLRRINARDIAEIRDHVKRTRIGGAILLRNAPGPPAGLTPTTISHWISGEAQSAKPDHVAFVLARYREWPSDEPSSYQPAAPSSPRVLIEGNDLAELRYHRDRTGIGGRVLLRTANDKPNGLTPEMITAWLAEATMSASPEHIAYVVARYRTWP